MKISGSLLQYYRDETALDSNNSITDSVPWSNNSILFKVKQQRAGKTGNGGSKNVEILVH